jgi:PAS domain S-box-containing protein
MKVRDVPDGPHLPRPDAGTTPVLFLKLFFLPFLVVAFGVFVYVQSDIDDRIQRLRAEEALNVEVGSASLAIDLQDQVGDLRYLVNLDASRAAVDDPSPSNLRVLGDKFRNFSQHDQLYDRIRWIDQRGLEQVRVDRHGWAIAIVPAQRLRYRGDSAYFRKAHAIRSGAIYVSHLDLNEDDGIVAGPHRPTVRIATPIIDSLGTRRGIFVVDLNVTTLLQSFMDATAAIADHIHLLNREGQWLINPDTSREWSLMFRASDRFGTLDPEAWKRVSAAERGQFESASGLVTFTTIRPLKLGRTMDVSQANLSVVHDGGPGLLAYQWKVVAVLPAARLAAVRARSSAHAALGAAAMLAMLGFGSWRQARAMQRRAQAENELSRKTAELKQAQRIARVGSWEWDRAGGRLDLSEELLRMLGCSAGDGPAAKARIRRVLSRDNVRRLRIGVRKAMADGTPFEVDLELAASPRLPGWITVRGEVRQDVDGRFRRLRGTVQDVTARKQAEARMQRFAGEIEDLYQNAPCGYHSVDPDGTIVRINQTELRWLGYARAEVEGKLSIYDLVAAADRDRFRQGFLGLQGAGAVREVEYLWLCRDGATIPVLLSAAAVRDDSGHMVMCRATVFDMTERKRMEQERALYSARIAEMSRHLVSVHEEEQRRLAEVLHDRTSANLAALKIEIDMLAADMAVEKSEKLDLRVESLRALLDDTATSIRETCSDLRPALLDYAGLLPALDEYARQFSRRTGIAVTLDGAGLERTLPTDIESKLFRIVQEALTNCAKHSKADAVRIELASDGGGTSLTISDNGVGFDPGNLARVGPKPGLGLLTMRERVEIVGGRFEVRSKPGAGTEISVLLAETTGSENGKQSPAMPVA